MLLFYNANNELTCFYYRFAADKTKKVTRNMEWYQKYAVFLLKY